MRKTCRVTLLIYLLAAALHISSVSPMQAQAQDSDTELYLVVELMRVDDEQQAAYQETERFWKKIHQERVKSGEILGWDLWSLQPGGEDQGYQFMTVSLYDDPAKMMGDADIMGHAQKAYPDMSEEELTERFNRTGTSRDLAVRLFLQQISTTDGDFSMELGTVAFHNFMKVEPGAYEDYEQAEMEIFRPYHQEAVDEGQRGAWGLHRVMSPSGSGAYASHVTVDMYESWDQVFSGTPGDEPSFADEMLIDRGLEMRDLKSTYIATLRDTVR